MPTSVGFAAPPPGVAAASVFVLVLLDADSFFADADAVVADFLVEVELEVEEADFFSSCTAGFRRGGADAAADWSDFISALHVWLGDGRVGTRADRLAVAVEVALDQQAMASVRSPFRPLQWLSIYGGASLPLP